MAAVSLAAVKTFLNITSTKNDDELLDTLERAEAIIASRVGPLSPVVVTDEVHSGPGPILLRRYPVISVASATSDSTAVTDLVLHGGVLYGSFYGYPRGVRVTYTVGRTAPLPVDLEAAVLELVHHLWTSQRGAATSVLADSGENDVQAGRGFLLPYRVQSLLEPYLLPSVA